MKLIREKKGFIIFVLILIAVAVVALTAFRMTGSMGIEDRYNHAVGLPIREGNGINGLSGVSVEGNPVLYVIIVFFLLAAGLAACRYLPEKTVQEPGNSREKTGK